MNGSGDGPVQNSNGNLNSGVSWLNSDYILYEQFCFKKQKHGNKKESIIRVLGLHEGDYAEVQL